MRIKANTTFGSAWMHRQLISILRFADPRLLYLFAAVFVVPVCLVTNRSRTTAYHYFRRRHGYGRLRAMWASYVNHCLFSQVVIDRFAMFAGRRFSVSVEGYSHFSRLEHSPEGFLQLSSHIGCYEVAGYSLVAEEKRLNALVFGAEKATVMQGREEQFSRNNIRMIPVLPDMSHLFAVNEALSNHETVSMPADRVMGSTKTLRATLLGAEASFPMGPFSVATMRGIDVIAVNVMKTSSLGYTAYVAPLAYDKQAPRREQMRQLVDGYASVLERMLRRYPTQWYNFYEFWA